MDREDEPDGREAAPRSRMQACRGWIIKHSVLLHAAAKVAALFVLVVLSLGLLLFTLLPPVDPVHKPDLKIPRNFDDLKRSVAVSACLAAHRH